MKRRLLILALSVLMIVSTIPAAALAPDGGRSDGWHSAYLQKADRASSGAIEGAISESAARRTEGSERYAANDIVRVSIELESLPTIEKYGARGLAGNKAAVNYRAKLKTEQDNAAKRISVLALGGKKLDVVWNLTLAVNIISANVEYGQIAGIERIPGVKSVVIENMYLPETTVEEDASASPKMIVGSKMTNTDAVWAKGYTGAGSRVAIVDTGIDVDHQSFDPGAFEYALGTLGKEVDLLTVDDIEAVLDQLNAKINDPELTANDLYINSKIPFAYNYVDKLTDVTHINDTQGAHGSHVAGIAAANRFLPDGNGGYIDALSSVYVQGQAPDAQMFAMKVFGRAGGAYDSDYYAAVEDAIILGADAANLSLGSACSGFSSNEEFRKVFEKIEKSDTLFTVSAGNSATKAFYTFEGYPYVEDKNMDTVGEPASLTSSLAVASVDNTGTGSRTLKCFGRSVFYVETEGANRDLMESLDGDYDFIAIDSIGTDEEFAAVADVLEGKIAICWRGELFFAEKADNAMRYGAAGIIICNHSTDNITMNLDEYHFSNPAVLISLKDGEFIFDNAEKVTDPETGDVLYYTGKVSMPDELVVSDPDTDYYVMSSFSSWGVPGSLILKPEITAPGGGIYSVGGAYKDKDGNIVSGSNDNYKNNADAAAQWVADNFKIEGKDVAVSVKDATNGAYKFVVITVSGIAIEDVKTPMAITVANADAGTVCVANYLAAVEAAYANKPAKAGQLNVARALFAYATALEAIG